MHYLDNKVFEITDARCSHDVYSVLSSNILSSKDGSEFNEDSILQTAKKIIRKNCTIREKF